MLEKQGCILQPYLEGFFCWMRINKHLLTKLVGSLLHEYYSNSARLTLWQKTLFQHKENRMINQYFALSQNRRDLYIFYVYKCIFSSCYHDDRVLWELLASFEILFYKSNTIILNRQNTHTSLQRKRAFVELWDKCRMRATSNPFWFTIILQRGYSFIKQLKKKKSNTCSSVRVAHQTGESQWPALVRALVPQAHYSACISYMSFLEKTKELFVEDHIRHQQIWQALRL